MVLVTVVNNQLIVHYSGIRKLNSQDITNSKKKNLRHLCAVTTNVLAKLVQTWLGVAFVHLATAYAGLVSILMPSVAIGAVS